MIPANDGGLSLAQGQGRSVVTGNFMPPREDAEQKVE